MSDDSIITQDEMDALLSGVSEGEVEADTGTPRPQGEVLRYDFSHPQYQLNTKLPVLDIVNEKLAKILAPQLTLAIHHPVSVVAKGVDVHKYNDYVTSLPAGMALNRARIMPLTGTAMFNVDAVIALTMVDFFFGGAGKISLEGEMLRDFTPTEQRIINKVLDATFNCMQTAWADVLHIQPEFIRAESSLRAQNPSNPADVMVTSRFEVSMAEGTGEFHIAMPYSMIEPIRHLLVSSIDRTPTDDQQWSNRFMERVMDAEIDLKGVIAQSEISLGELLRMGDGDLVPIGQSRSAAFYAENMALFDAVIGVSNGRVSAKVIHHRTRGGVMK